MSSLEIKAFCLTLPTNPTAFGAPTKPTGRVSGDESRKGVAQHLKRRPTSPAKASYTAYHSELLA